MRRTARGMTLLLSWVLLLGCGTESPPAGRPPNIVLIVADDLGWNDVGYHGSAITTPNIDRLAAEGVELHRFYTMVNCSPTRMGLLTGRYPIRWGMMNTVIRPWEAAGLPPAEETIPEMLADLGYEHRALVGKWHVGHGSREQHPLRQGFTEFYGHYNGSIDYFDHTREGQVDWHRGFESVDENGQYTTDLITDEAVRFIEAHRSGPPFFLFVSFNAPHFPMQAPRRYMDRVSHIEGEKRRLYAAMVSCMDDGIGRIMAALDEGDLTQDSLVWFLSDNGGSRQYGASNAPLRGEKASVFEGGVRVPAAVRWPGGGLAGGRRVTGTTGYVDVFPTLRAAAGAQSSAPSLDGVDLLPYLRESAPEPGRDWYTFTSLNVELAGRGGEGMAVTTPEWKLVRHGPRLTRDPDGTAGSVALFRIREDPHEKQNVAARHPDVVQDLLAKLRKFRALQPARALVPSSVQSPSGWRAPPQWRLPD